MYRWEFSIHHYGIDKLNIFFWDHGSWTVGSKDFCTKPCDTYNVLADIVHFFYYRCNIWLILRSVHTHLQRNSFRLGYCLNNKTSCGFVTLSCFFVIFCTYKLYLCLKVYKSYFCVTAEKKERNLCPFWEIVHFVK